MALIRSTRVFHFVTGSIIRTMSTTWWASLWSLDDAAWPVIATIGARSRKASATPVTRFVAPGPSVPIATAARPVSRPWTSAMNAAPCSWRVVTWRICGRRREGIEDVHRLLAGHGEDGVAALGDEALDEQVGGTTAGRGCGHGRVIVSLDRRIGAAAGGSAAPQRRSDQTRPLGPTVARAARWPDDTRHASEPAGPRARAHRADPRRGIPRARHDRHGGPRQGDAPSTHRGRAADRCRRPRAVPARRRRSRHRVRPALVPAVRPRREPARRPRRGPRPLRARLVRAQVARPPDRRGPPGDLDRLRRVRPARRRARSTSPTSPRRSRPTTTSRRRSPTPGGSTCP